MLQSLILMVHSNISITIFFNLQVSQTRKVVIHPNGYNSHHHLMPPLTPPSHSSSPTSSQDNVTLESRNSGWYLFIRSGNFTCIFIFNNFQNLLGPVPSYLSRNVVTEKSQKILRDQGLGLRHQAKSPI